MAKISAIFMVALFVSAAVVAPRAQGVTCSTVTSTLQSCGSAVQKGGSASPDCCRAIKSLNNAANTKPARKTICECVKTLAKTYKVSTQTISSIAKKCNVGISNLGSNVDCNKA
ncbi:non-specific lipid-transfer protein-like [Salvia miltiorrhiza]|uniref:non-specific lipid-transfer protein-like n=1 Tax=Salvia miltiorrhiza TaxID=226208 RepID=UPI0025ABF5E1|nr:non-specific lipid-transfer protein-like [Salvia miltiorrhiza]